MRDVVRSPKFWLWSALAIVLGLIVTLPLSVAFSLFGLRDMGVSAKSLRGPVWWGGAEELSVGKVRLGTVDVFLSPFHFFLGQARVDIARLTGQLDTSLVGGLTIGWGTRGLDRVTGTFSLAQTLAPLPVSRVEFDKFTARFSGGRCALAEGRVRVHVPALIAGMDLSNGLSGEARCEGESLLLPLVSQSGQQKLDMRIRADGAYEASMHIETGDAVLASSLAASGFVPAGNGAQVLRIAGSL